MHKKKQEEACGIVVADSLNKDIGEAGERWTKQGMEVVEEN